MAEIVFAFSKILYEEVKMERKRSDFSASASRKRL
jgi:hypothetical protein